MAEQPGQPLGQPPDQQERERVLRRFLGPDGRITSMPAKASKRLPVLDHVAQAFAIGERFAEAEVDAVLRGFHDDYPALRRYLVEGGFLEREHTIYWRAGGSVDL